MRHVLSRQQLYDMSWELAVSKAAPELGISDVAPRKHCVKHATPLPDAPTNDGNSVVSAAIFTVARCRCRLFLLC
jgi:hypothetical protein